MAKIESAITVLTCTGPDKSATKKFIMQANGKIKKVSFNAGKYFKHEEILVHDLESLGNAISSLAVEPRKLVIKGQIRKGMSEIVRRKLHDPEAAFDDVARPYLMLDIDGVSGHPLMMPEENPEGVVGWILATLPKPFRNASCYYQFSASQSVPLEGKDKVSLHLWFWCDKPTLDNEWKRYFKSVNSDVDMAIFSPVQIHYTANPIFENMEDPLPNRSGFYKGKSGVVQVPNIPKPELRQSSPRLATVVMPDEESREKALNLLKPHYKEGVRDRMSGAVAGMLYRGGWCSENVAEFVYDLAIATGDEEADHRYQNALRICDAIDDNLPAQGIPTLKDELKIENTEQILNLLRLGKLDLQQHIDSLSNKSSIDDIKSVLGFFVDLSEAEQKLNLDRLQDITKANKSTLESILKEVMLNKKIAHDKADVLMEVFLKEKYSGGQHLMFSSDKTYFQYNGKCWEKIPEQHIKKSLLSLGRDFKGVIGKSSLRSVIDNILSLLEGRVYQENNPMRQVNRDAPPVINCRNGELWFDKNGNVSLKPHRADSYLRNCLDVDYDPAATSPMFDQAIREIFSNSSDPEDMTRHFIELAGYICQPWRKIAMIVILYGGGSNGKTSLIGIVQRILGENTVMSDRISDIEGNIFKIGDLDGKLMFLDEDVDSGTYLPDGMLKKISERKSLTGQHKHKDSFEFICRAVPVMATNDYPKTKDLSHGLYRRMQIVPFGRTFTEDEMDHELFDRIWENEASGILNHFVRGFGQLRARKKLKKPIDCLQAEKEWFARANILTAFIDDACEVGKSYREPLGDFYSAFQHYCQANGLKSIQTMKTVKNHLIGLKYRIDLLDGKDAVWGLRLKPVQESIIAQPDL